MGMNKRFGEKNEDWSFNTTLNYLYLQCALLTTCITQKTLSGKTIVLW